MNYGEDQYQIKNEHRHIPKTWELWGSNVDRNPNGTFQKIQIQLLYYILLH